MSILCRDVNVKWSFVLIVLACISGCIPVMNTRLISELSEEELFMKLLPELNSLLVTIGFEELHKSYDESNIAGYKSYYVHDERIYITATIYKSKQIVQIDLSEMTSKNNYTDEAAIRYQKISKFLKKHGFSQRKI